MLRFVLPCLLPFTWAIIGADSIDSLAKIAADKNADMAARVAAVQKLGQAGAAAKPAVPSIAAAYEEFLLFQDANKDIIEGRRQPTPAEEEKLMKTIDKIGELYHSCATALSDIGPDAAAALPVLLKDLKQNKAGIAGGTILKIDPNRAVEVNEIMIVVQIKLWIYLQGRGLERTKAYAMNYKDLENFGREPPLKDEPLPPWDYRIRFLTAQSERAQGGKQSYLADGIATKGYGFVVYPAAYGKTANRTFVVVKAGAAPEKTYRADLGPKTREIVEKMTEWDPQDAWKEGLE